MAPRLQPPNVSSPQHSHLGTPDARTPAQAHLARRHRRTSAPSPGSRHTGTPGTLAHLCSHHRAPLVVALASLALSGVSALTGTFRPSSSYAARQLSRGEYVHTWLSLFWVASRLVLQGSALRLPDSLSLVLWHVLGLHQLVAECSPSSGLCLCVAERSRCVSGSVSERVGKVVALGEKRSPRPCNRQMQPWFA